MCENIMIGSGQGILDWSANMGRFVLKPGFVGYRDELIEDL